MDTTSLYQELDRQYGTGRPEKVEQYLLDKLKEGQAQADLANDTDLLIWAHNELGSLYRGLGRFELSEREFLRAIELLSGLEGEHREELAITYNNLGGSYRMAGRTDDALQVFQKAMDLYAGMDGFDEYGYASAFNNLALVYESLDQTATAIAYLVTALEQLKSRGLLLPVAISETNLALLLNKIGERDRALELLDKAEATFTTHFPGDYHQAALLAAQGSLQAAAGDAEAILSYQAAAEIIKAHYGESHEYQLMQKNIAILLERFGPGACKLNKAAGSEAVCE